MLVKKVICASNSRAASDRAIYSASIVDNAIDDCFCDVHDIGPPFIMKMYPIVDFLSTMLDPRFAST